ncbi:putative Chaperone J-domain superfamily [Helianthus annuus]|nr:putative Chaperone J-domain superfamily [Helianthus annuus]KAJ0567540.1 putative Chaperone J-domain superfamily [Helianthus annuus]KAJ0915998.1 putative Chaperone J-domain superfamily [Helianthus annuus]
MDDFGILARDFGFKPQGKSAPMKSDAAGGRGRSRPPSSSPPPFNDDFSNSVKFTNSNARSTPVTSDIDYDSIFNNSYTNNEAKSKSVGSSLPVYDKPVYDEDIFDGLPGMKSKSLYSDNVFASMTSSPPKPSQRRDDFDDLLGNLGRTETVDSVKEKDSRSSRGLDDLFSGFGSGGGSVSGSRPTSESVPASTSNNTKATSNAMDDPFVVLESTSTPVTSSQSVFIDPPETIHKVSKTGSTYAGGSSVNSGMFDDIDPLHGFGKPAPTFPSDTNTKRKDHSPSKEDKSSVKYSESESQKVHVEDFQESQQPIFDMPPVNKFSQRSVDRATSPPLYTETNSRASSDENVQPLDDIWLIVSEIPLFTQPTRAPPPSRPPPPIPRHASKSVRGSFVSNTTTFGNDYSASPKYSSFNPFQPAAKSPMSSSLDEFENGEEMDSNSASAAMKDAMDRAEAKFRHAKELREREHAKASRNKDDLSTEEREKSRLEREKGRQAVERATREARERAASEAREKASAEARLKSERAAVQRAQAEARERAAIDAKGRAERAAAEATEKAAVEAREKAARVKAAVARADAEVRRRAERATVDKVAAEARQRAAAEARDRAAAAAAAKMNQQKNDDDLESFFSSRPSSAPRPRGTSSDPAPDPLFQNRQEAPQRTSSTGGSSNMRKASSTTNIVDDLSSIFGAAPSSAGEFQDVEGETEERRRARLERHQRTQERAAKALAEKNNRDLQSLREQEERNRISETLDIEIKRWAAGKEGNLRALLSTLQYVLWPGCGWQPVSLTDLITGANVKKSYRKATLCIHPDKVQQKGATLQQKFVAEKVFDLLKEAWNKFNSEELF